MAGLGTKRLNKELAKVLFMPVCAFPGVSSIDGSDNFPPRLRMAYRLAYLLCPPITWRNGSLTFKCSIRILYMQVRRIGSSSDSATSIQSVRVLDSTMQRTGLGKTDVE